MNQCARVNAQGALSSRSQLHARLCAAFSPLAPARGLMGGRQRAAAAHARLTTSVDYQARMPGPQARAPGRRAQGVRAGHPHLPRALIGKSRSRVKGGGARESIAKLHVPA